jgi:hypothetical protein
MVKRLIAIGFIFACTSAAWMILGSTINIRTNSSGDRLRGRVQSVWGTPQAQLAPAAELVGRTAPPDKSDINVDLQLEYRRKGLLWYSTYKVGFAGDYEFENPCSVAQTLRLSLQLPATQALYDDLQFSVNGQPSIPVTEKDRAYVDVNVPAGQTVKLRVGYRSQGLESWRYNFGKDINAVSNFHLRMNTNFRDIDFPDNTLAPFEKHETPTGWQLDWTYKKLLSGYEIALAMPEKVQPGPLASQISFFAPVSLFFFFFLMYIVTTMQGAELHPMNYFFLACAFFAFHLLLAYLADHLDIFVSFGIAAAVSVFLVVRYLRIVAGPRFALREAALTQFVYLILFSAAFFFRGFTGLTITIGSILTLFIVMQLTARVSWSDKFASTPPRIPAPVR